jgi:hypothetical protein
MQLNERVQARGGLVWRRPLVLGTSVAALIVAAAIIALLLLAGANQQQAAPTAPQPSHASVPAQGVLRPGHPPQ